jgi:hypothetical protein
MKARLLLARTIRRFFPLSVVERRRHTETIVRGMFERYRGTKLDDEFGKLDVEGYEVDKLFDAIDFRFGEALASYDMKRVDAALNGAFLLVAGFVIEKQG